MSDTNATPSATPGRKHSRGRNNAQKKTRETKGKTDTPAVNNRINFKADAGEDNPIWQAVNYAYNRLCGAHQNQTTPFTAIDLVAYTREKFGPKVMTVQSQTA